MIDLEVRPNGVVLPVRAQPGAKSNALRGEQNGALKVSVTQIAEKGKANKAIVATICKGLKLRKSQVQLISGPANPQKRLLIGDIDVEELRQRIQSAIG